MRTAASVDLKMAILSSIFVVFLRAFDGIKRTVAPISSPSLSTTLVELHAVLVASHIQGAAGIRTFMTTTSDNEILKQTTLLARIYTEIV